MQDHFRALGLLSIADDVVIKAAFKALAQEYHPDKYEGDSRHAQKVMADLNAAYAEALKTKALETSLRRQTVSVRRKARAKRSPPPTRKRDARRTGSRNQEECTRRNGCHHSF
jgi:DnaJ-class molecular chaperone